MIIQEKDLSGLFDFRTDIQKIADGKLNKDKRTDTREIFENYGKAHPELTSYSWEYNYGGYWASYDAIVNKLGGWGAVEAQKLKDALNKAYPSFMKIQLSNFTSILDDLSNEIYNATNYTKEDTGNVTVPTDPTNIYTDAEQGLIDSGEKAEAFVNKIKEEAKKMIGSQWDKLKTPLMIAGVAIGVLAVTYIWNSFKGVRQ